MESYCESIAAIKVRTPNKKGRHLSTSEAIRLLENYGIEIPSGFIRAPESIFKIPAINRYLKQFQIERYLDLAVDKGYRLSQKRITIDIIENVFAPDLGGLESRLTRHGYNVKALADLLNVRPTEIRTFLHGQLTPGRNQELQNQMLTIGIPL